MAISQHQLLKALRYVYPATVFVYFLASSALAACNLQNQAPATRRPRRSLILYLVLAVVLTYSAQCILTLARWQAVQQDSIVSLLACAMVYGLEFAVLHDTQSPAWHSYTGSFVIALAFEPLLAVLSLRSQDHHPLLPVQVLDFVVLATRLVCLVSALIAYFAGQRHDHTDTASDAERQSLLRKRSDGESEDTLVTEYGSTEAVSEESGKTTGKDPESDWERSQRLVEEKRDKRLQESGNWLTYAKSFKLFLPYIWPAHDRRLQAHAALAGCCLLMKNVLNVLIPNQLGVVTKTLTDAAGQDTPVTSLNPWTQVLIFALLKLSASEAGLSLLRRRLWLPVEQYSERALVEAAHSHIMNLDAHFHDTKSLSDMLMAIQRGDSITNMLETICFEMLPNLIDLGVAFIYLTVKFGPWEGLITISTTTFFIYLSTAVISTSRVARQAYSKAWYEEWYIMNSSLSGWTTVASFNQVAYETSRFSRAVQDRISKSRAYALHIYRSQAFQYLILSAGLLAGLFLAVWKVTREHSIDASDFVVLLTYWSQLVGPLNYFAGLSKSVNKDLIDAERLLEIMETQSKISNKPEAPEFQFKAGRVEFQGVCFSYDKKKEILKDVSFKVVPGQTIA